MNYFLILVILAMSGGAYYVHTQDQQKISDLQVQVDDLTAKVKIAADAAATTVRVVPVVSPPTPTNPTTSGLPRIGPGLNSSGPATGVVGPDPSHSSAIDAAAMAAAAASNSAGVGTIKTLDGKTYTNCKVLKVEQDGVTFSHDDGITKILYPLMPPEVQKLFNYDPQKAVAQTDAQIHYDEQQSAASNSAPAAPAATNP